ncbi:MAG TPA: hypothetical protein VJS43_11925 [Candidatus Acidoferrales bacterium]|nr:hypothetical protein [Candidatus Acidoferrales bacterium]
MRTICKAVVYTTFLAIVIASGSAVRAAQTAPAVAATRAIGTVQSISGSSLTLKSDQGVLFSVTVQEGAKVLRLEPGQTSLSSAVPLPLSDIQAGDRVLASGSPGSAEHAILASSVIAIKKADVEAKQQQDLQAWTSRGVGGLVASVDPAVATVSLKVGTLSGTKTVTVHTAKSTQILRYAPDSVKFSDAKPSTLDEIKPGDQLLARGTRSADGNDLTADAVVSGGFRNLSGAISSVNAVQNTLALKDVATKQTFTVKIAPDSELRKLSTQEAAMLAARMKAANGANGPGAGSTAGGGGQDAGQAGGRGLGRGGRFGGRGGGGGDLSQVIARAPKVTLADLQKGDAVMIVSTAGDGSGDVSAIQVVAGVEAILEAAPSASLPAWDVTGGGGGGGDASE